MNYKTYKLNVDEPPQLPDMHRWRKVRHIPGTAAAWHTAADDLAGTAEYGDPDDDSQPWSIKFDNLTFSKFLFAFGDKTTWLIAYKADVAIPA